MNFINAEFHVESIQRIIRSAHVENKALQSALAQSKERIASLEKQSAYHHSGEYECLMNKYQAMLTRNDKQFLLLQERNKEINRLNNIIKAQYEIQAQMSRTIYNDGLKMLQLEGTIKLIHNELKKYNRAS